MEGKRGSECLLKSVSNIDFNPPNHEEILVVKNNCKETTIDKRKIFELGYSSKGKGRGIGLATVKGLLIKHPNINLETEFKNHFFTQTLVLQEEP